MLVSEALALIQSQGGFDPSVAQTSDTLMRSWLSTAVAEAVAEARWLKQRREFGPTVIGISEYTVDTDVIWVKSLRVGVSRPWARTTLEDLWVAEADPGAVYLTDRTVGAFAPVWESESAQDVDDVPKLVKIWPTPTAAGLAITAVCAVSHKPIVAATSAAYQLQLPDDLAQKIAVDGAVAIGVQRVHERADLAAPYLARYADGKALLKARANSLIGGGVRYARIRGR